MEIYLNAILFDLWFRHRGYKQKKLKFRAGKLFNYLIFFRPNSWLIKHNKKITIKRTMILEASGLTAQSIRILAHPLITEEFSTFLISAQIKICFFKQPKKKYHQIPSLPVCRHVWWK